MTLFVTLNFMIISFEYVNTQTPFEQKRVAQFANIQKVILHKVAQLNAVLSLDFLCLPPGNPLVKVGIITMIQWQDHHATYVKR